MKLTLKIWRQPNAESKGSMVSYEIDEISPDMSFLEMMDVLNEELTIKGIDPVAFAIFVLPVMANNYLM